MWWSGRWREGVCCFVVVVVIVLFLFLLLLLCVCVCVLAGWVGGNLFDIGGCRRVGGGGGGENKHLCHCHVPVELSS